jgi:hypothetical protein
VLGGAFSFPEAAQFYLSRPNAPFSTTRALNGFHPSSPLFAPPVILLPRFLLARARAAVRKPPSIAHDRFAIRIIIARRPRGFI